MTFDQVAVAGSCRPRSGRRNRPPAGDRASSTRPDDRQSASKTSRRPASRSSRQGSRRQVLSGARTEIRPAGQRGRSRAAGGRSHRKHWSRNNSVELPRPDAKVAASSTSRPGNCVASSSREPVQHGPRRAADRWQAARGPSEQPSIERRLPPGDHQPISARPRHPERVKSSAARVVGRRFTSAVDSRRIDDSQDSCGAAVSRFPWLGGRRFWATPEGTEGSVSRRPPRSSVAHRAPGGRAPSSRPPGFTGPAEALRV